MSTKSGAGQYFTPRPLIRAMVDVIQPEPGIIAAEIVEDLEAALEQFREIVDDIGSAE